MTILPKLNDCETLKKERVRIEKIYAPIREELQRVENELINQLNAENKTLAPIDKYIIGLSGKMLRPALVLSCRKINKGGDEEKAIKLAVGIELIHMATLIHDDVIDEAKFRRFKKTINEKWGAEVAILMGDYLYSKAFEVLSNNIDPEILKVLSEATNKMCLGEIEQYKYRYNPLLTEKKYLEIIEKKTACFISATCKAGAMVAGLSKGEIISLANYGRYIGLSFQIVDDCLDIAGIYSTTGKEVLNDLNKGKLTLPFIHALRKNKRFYDPFDRDRKYMVKLVEEKQSLRYSYQRARDFAELAKFNLNRLGDSESKKIFYQIADFIVERSY